MVTTSSRGLKGLPNYGNTCFVNAALQALFSSSKLLGKLRSHRDVALEAGCTATCVACLSCTLASDVRPEAFHITSEASVRSAVRRIMELVCPEMEFGSQQDSHAFLTKLLDRLDTELGRNLGGIGLGEQEWKTQCIQCRGYSTVRCVFRDIQLPAVEPSVTRSLDQLLSRGEKMDQYNKMHCTTCKEATQVVRFLKIESVPDILILEIARFQYNVAEQRAERVETRTTLPPVLNLMGTDLTCIGIVLHEGPSCQRGHYRAAALAAPGQWYLCDDSVVEERDWAQLDWRNDIYYAVYERSSWTSQSPTLLLNISTYQHWSQSKSTSSTGTVKSYPGRTKPARPSPQVSSDALCSLAKESSGVLVPDVSSSSVPLSYYGPSATTVEEGAFTSDKESAHRVYSGPTKLRGRSSSQVSTDSLDTLVGGTSGVLVPNVSSGSVNLALDGPTAASSEETFAYSECSGTPKITGQHGKIYSSTPQHSRRHRYSSLSPMLDSPSSDSEEQEVEPVTVRSPRHSAGVVAERILRKGGSPTHGRGVLAGVGIPPFFTPSPQRCRPCGERRRVDPDSWRTRLASRTRHNNISGIRKRKCRQCTGINVAALEKIQEEALDMWQSMIESTYL